ncbi:hypothetical protein X736_31350 [Mesorhizobium sp. L2C089B000]|nr:hypothetical protein X736_31350 [Mesorhizobium sp. L2C089B000]
MRFSYLLATFVVVLLCLPAQAQMQCAAPSQHVVVTNEASGIVNQEQPIKQTVTDLIQRYPQADRLLLQRDLISAVCELIKASPNTEFAEKAKLLIDLTKEIQSAFGSASTSIDVIGDYFAISTRLPTGNIGYALLMGTEYHVYAKCKVDEPHHELEYGNPVIFDGLFYTYDKSEIRRTRPDVERSVKGNLLFSIPKGFLFEPGDSAREGLDYFRDIPNANCFVGDVNIHVAIWDKTTGTYILNRKIFSVTSHWRCAIVMENEATTDYENVVNEYKAYIRTLADKTSRSYLTAPKSDAFWAVDEAKKENAADASNSLAVVFSGNLTWTKCMTVSLSDALNTIK